MQTVKTEIYTAPRIGARVFRFNNPTGASAPPLLTVKNRGDSASLSLSLQESDDGSNFSEIDGTNKTVAPLKSESIAVVSSRRFVAVFAAGDVDFEAAVSFCTDGAPLTDIGGAI